jgi:hypothetical protein
MSDETRLVVAIMERDFDAAMALLEVMKWTSERWSQAVMDARIAVSPPAPLPPMLVPLILPAPGHLPGSTLGDPRLAA